MQSPLVLFCVISIPAVSVAADVQPEQAKALLSGNWVSLGPVGGAVSIGSVPTVYSTEYQKDKMATASAMMFLELSRRMFPTGVFRMPPLDPYVRTSLEPVQVQHKYAKGSITFSDAVVRGAKDFDLQDMRIRLNYPEGGTYRLDYNLTIPKLGFKSNFETRILLGPKKIPVNLDGSIQAVFDNLLAAGAIGARMVPRHGFVPDQVQFVGLMGRGGAPYVHVKLQLSNGASNLLDSNGMALKLFYQFVKQDLADAVGKELLDLGNKVLRGFTLQQLQAALLHDNF